MYRTKTSCEEIDQNDISWLECGVEFWDMFRSSLGSMLSCLQPRQSWHYEKKKFVLLIVCVYLQMPESDQYLSVSKQIFLLIFDLFHVRLQLGYLIFPFVARQNNKYITLKRMVTALGELSIFQMSLRSFFSIFGHLISLVFKGNWEDVFFSSPLFMLRATVEKDGNGC